MVARKTNSKFSRMRLSDYIFWLKKTQSETNQKYLWSCKKPLKIRNLFFVRICGEQQITSFYTFFSFFSGGTSSLKKMDNYAEIGAPEISGTSSILSVAERNRNNFPNQSQERLLKWTKVTNKPVPCGRKLSHIKFIYSEKAAKIWRNLQTFFDATKYFQIKLGVFVKF